LVTWPRLHKLANVHVTELTWPLGLDYTN